MLEMLVAAIWSCLVGYLFWYFFLARDYEPLSVKEAEMLWKAHKQSSHCRAEGWRQILYKGRLVGFECDCGYKYLQKRPLTVKSPPTWIYQAHVKNKRIP